MNQDADCDGKAGEASSDGERFSKEGYGRRGRVGLMGRGQSEQGRHSRQCGEGTIWKGGEGFGIAGGEWYGEGREEGRARRGLVTQGIAGTV